MHLLFSLCILTIGTRSCLSVSRNADFTDSYIPAGLQVMSDFVVQLQEQHEEEVGSRRTLSDSSQESDKHQGWYEKSHEFGDLDSRSTKKTEGKMKVLIKALTREAKRQNLGDYQGFSRKVIDDLEESSKMSSGDQLSYILERIAAGEVRRADLRTQLVDFLKDLKNNRSDMKRDLESVKPLQYS